MLSAQLYCSSSYSPETGSLTELGASMVASKFSDLPVSTLHSIGDTSTQDHALLLMWVLGI